MMPTATASARSFFHMAGDSGRGTGGYPILQDARARGSREQVGNRERGDGVAVGGQGQGGGGRLSLHPYAPFGDGACLPACRSGDTATHHPTTLISAFTEWY